MLQPLPTITIVGAIGSVSASLCASCHRIGLKPRLADGVHRPVAVGSPLALVDAGVAFAGPGDLLAQLRRAGIARVVLVGPSHGSLGQALALQHGFDEVWDRHSSPLVLEWLLRRAVERLAAGPRSLFDALGAVDRIAGTAAAMPGAAVALRVGPFSLDLPSRTLREPGRDHALSAHTCSLLAALMRAHPGAASRTQLTHALRAWPRRPGSASRAIDQRVANARKDLGALGVRGLLLCAERGVGYRLVVDSKTNSTSASDRLAAARA